MGADSMATYTIAGYDVNDVVIVSGADPFADFNDATPAAIGTVFYVTNDPDQITVTDSDTLFDETDGDQEVAFDTSQNSGTASAGTNIDPEYTYVVRPPGGNPDGSDDFRIHAYEMGIGPGADGFVTELKLLPGQHYTIISIASESPEPSYASLYVCFTPGTRIGVARGAVPVEALGPGDLVRTADAGLVPIRWAGARWLGRRVLRDRPELAPVRIAAGALGQGLPLRPLTLSPQHRVLLRSPLVAAATGRPEALLPAHALTGLRGIRRRPGLQSVCYLHLLLPAHHVIEAEGAPVESLLLGDLARDALTETHGAELAGLRLPSMKPARPLIEGRAARDLVRRHRRDGLPLLSPAPLASRPASV